MNANAMIQRLTFFIFVLAASSLQAQFIVLKDSTRIPASQLEFAGGKLNRNITLSNGQPAKQTIDVSGVDHMEWGTPKEVLQAQSMLASGKTKEAIDLLEKAMAFFAPFKSTAGTPYPEVVLAHLAALDQSGDFDALLKAMPEAKSLKLDDDHKLQLRIIQLNMDRRTSSDQEKILSDAERILSSTDDSNVSARLWITIADVHFKKERWEKAFDAYLHVPVFYGSQGALVPQAELLAARCLVKMERFKDAAAMFDRIAESYKGSEIGDTAKKEFLTVNGRENKADKPASSSKDSTKKTEDKKS
jgi:tetratricopeptide (TPR) repeat protein